MDLGGGPRDEFEELTLDEDFVRQGAKELSAEDRLRRAQRIAAHEDELARRRNQVRRTNRVHRRVGRALRKRVPRFRTVVGVLVVAGIVAWYVTGYEAASGPTAMFDADTPVARSLDGAEWPTPQPDTSGTRLEVAPTAPPEIGAYRFLATQAGSDAPVRYDPCRTISIVLNERTAPAGAREVLDEALLMVKYATGLRLEIEAVTDEPPSDDRAHMDRERYGDRWSPVLIAWTDPSEYPPIAGDVAGTGGSDFVEDPKTGTFVYVTGQVALDGPDFADFMQGDTGKAAARAVILHELAHLVGLHHVDDATSLMHPEGSDEVIDFAAGDLHGLAALGSGPCLSGF